MTAQQCPLCQDEATLWLETSISFYLCSRCKLISKDRVVLLSAEDERARYEHHNNDPTDPDYQTFLRRLLDPIIPLLAPSASGLDFGCGPTKAIELLLSSQGHFVESYDPFFFPNKKLLQQQYDFITSSEVFEHLFSPSQELATLRACLNPAGILAIMTSTYPEKKDFKQWYYWKDPTHVCFYSDATFEYIAKQFCLVLFATKKNCFYFRKIN